jgi:hypothetical protein
MSVALSVSESQRHRLLVRWTCDDRSGLTATVQTVCAVLPATVVPGSVQVGIEAAGHYHRPLLAPTKVGPRRPLEATAVQAGAFCPTAKTSRHSRQSPYSIPVQVLKPAILLLQGTAAETLQL